MRPTIQYSSETRTLSVGDVNSLLAFERQVLRRVCTEVQTEERWSMRDKDEFDKLMTGESIVEYVRAQRITYLGRRNRMEKAKRVRTIME
jgi:hypothetical protein